MTTSSYDDFPYHSVLGYDFQPTALATVATLFGLSPPPVETAKILEIGCGDATNTIAIAQSLPKAACWGIDISEKQLARGQAVVDAVGLLNVTLKQVDLMTVDEAFGQFDYIIVHGLFAWVPPEVQQKILQVCHHNLSTHGIACVSYNTLPGWNMLKTIRDMLQFHQQHIGEETIAQRLEEAKEVLKIATEVNTEQQTFYSLFLQQSQLSLQNLGDEYLFHEYLEGVNQPLYFKDFMAQAQQHQLGYVTDVEFRQYLNIQSKHQAVFEKLAKQNFIIREQYLDFFFNRSFRSSILCHAQQSVKPVFDWKMLFALKIAANLIATTEEWPETIEPKPAEFKKADGNSLTINHTLTQIALRYLQEIYPHAISFDELFKKIRDKMQLKPHGPAKIAVYRQVLAEEFLTLYIANQLELTVHTPHFVTYVSDYPTASPLARWQAKQAQPIASLQCKTGHLDHLSNTILQHLDGQHDREALLKVLLSLLETGQIKIEFDENMPAEEDKEAAIERTLRTVLDNVLNNMAKNALLIA